ncbi:MAG: hypothetical protein WC923_08830, partial [Bacteroidales bacterium]
MNTMQNPNIKLLFSIYFLPICIFGAFIAWNFSNILAESILSAGLFILTVLLFIGTILCFRNSDESIKSLFEFLALFTALLVIGEIVFGIISVIASGGATLTVLLRMPVWLTLMYLILIASPMMTSVVRKVSTDFACGKMMKRTSYTFSVWGFVLLVCYVILSVLGDANDVVIEGTVQT